MNIINILKRLGIVGGNIIFDAMRQRRCYRRSPTFAFSIIIFFFTIQTFL